MTKQNNNFNFWVPVSIEKGTEEGQPMKVSGVCSSEATDTDGEDLNPSGFDFQPLLDKGFFNYNHKGNTDPGAIIGEPTAARLIADQNQLYVEGFLYPNEAGKRTYDLAVTLEKHSPNRRLGWSIEGQVVERDRLNPKKVLRAIITGVAITPMPKNPNTFVNIMKGEYSEPFVESEAKTCPECDHDQLIDGKCIECGYQEGDLDKSMDTENMAPTRPESVEGKKQPKINNEDDINKSDIYHQILSKGYSNDPIILDQIYNLIQKQQMTTNNTIEKAIESSFEMLDSLIKGGDKSTMLSSETTSDDDEDDDDLEKGLIASCFKYINAGMDESNCVENLVKRGVTMDIAQLTYLHCISDASANNMGDEANGNAMSFKASGSIVKGDEGSALTERRVISIIEERMNDTLSSLTQLLDKKLAPITESFQKSQEFGQRLAEFEQVIKQPIPARSITRQPIEKFQKGGDGIQLSTNSKNDMQYLSNTLLAEAERVRSNGVPNMRLEKAVADLEIVKATDFNAISTELKLLNINLIQN